jgi:DNA-binding MarR family transcriptional regulator
VLWHKFSWFLVVFFIIALTRPKTKLRFHNVLIAHLFTDLLRDYSRFCYAFRMNTNTTTEQTLALAFASAWNRLERRLDGSLGAIRGISLAEYRLLRALGDAPGSQASRVDLAQAVGLTPSGVTRALRPMEKLSIVSTVKSKRDARLAIAALTPAGRELLDDASGVVDDTMKTVLKRSPELSEKMEALIELLDDFSR